MKYSVEIEVNGKREKMCMSGGKVYKFSSWNRAFAAGRLAYGGNFIPFWVVENQEKEVEE